MLGKFLRKARKDAGLSQETLAARAHIDRSYLSELERDEGSPTVQLLIRLCSAMGVSAGKIISQIEAKPVRRPRK
jgi:transcriptional regulator with XRE-family HTH domain